MAKSIVSIALILASGLGYGEIPIPAERNLVRNGGFEAGTEGWRMPSAGHYRIEPGVGRGGSAALVFDCDAVPPFTFPRQWIAGVRAGRAYRFGGWLKVERLTQTVKDLKYMVSFDWYAAERRLAGQRAFEVVDNAVGDAGGWMRFEGTSRYLEQELARAELLVLGGRGAYGRILFDDFWMEELPYEPVGNLVTSAYRDTAAEGKVRLVAELHINLGETPLEALAPEFTYVGADGKERRVKPDRFDATAAEVELDVSALAIGTRPITFELKDGTGMSLGRCAIRFTREKRHVTRKVEIDAHGRCLVDGKPFFPYGMYTKPLTQEELDIYCEAPFNMLENYTLLDTPQLDMIHEKGLKLLYCIGAYYYNYGHDPRRFKDDADAAAFVTGVIERHRDHPALLGWYCCDEMPISFIPTIEERYRLVKRLDPEHPVWIVLDRPQNIRRYIRCFDAVGSDPYPIGAMGADCNRTEMTGEWTATTKEQTFGLKPVWEVPQAMNWGWYRTPSPGQEYRYPTEKEFRNMTWQSVAAGANGIVYYCFHTMRRLLPGDGYRTEWSKVLKVSKEFTPFFDVFLSVDPHDELAGAPRGVFTRNWNFRGEEWVLVVNGTNAPKDVVLTLARRYASASVAFGDALRLGGKSLSGTLPPLGISFMKLKATTEKTGLDRTRFNIGAYRFGDRIPGFRTEEHVRELKEAGIDFIASMRPGTDAEAFYRTMDLFEKYGVGAIPEGGDAIGASCPVKAFGRVKEGKPMSPSVYVDAAKRFRPHPAIWGIDVGDEPHGMDLPNVGKAVELCSRLFPVPFLYVNLFPSYARLATNAADIVNSQLGSASYKDYIEEYCRYVPLDYVSFDIYPYSQSAPKGVRTFFNNLKIVADACVKHGKALWVVGQVNTWAPGEPLAANKMRYQAFAGLAFGAEAMTWACWTKGWWNNNVYSETGEKTVTYDRVKTVNAELRRLGDECLRYRRVATHFVGYTGRYEVYLQGCEGVSEKSVSTEWFRDVAAEDGEPVLVAEMVPRDSRAAGAQAIFVMASEDPYDKNEKERVIRFRTLRRTVGALGVDGPLPVGRDAEGWSTVTLRSNRAALVWTR